MNCPVPEGLEADFDANVLAPWRIEGRPLVSDHWDRFHALLEPANDLISRKHYREAASTLQVAANHAVLWHPGIFSSPELESVIAALGSVALDHPGVVAQGQGQRRVVHVATRIGPIGGHVRMMSHWIETDRASRHTVALTRQQDEIPQVLRSAVEHAGSTVVEVNRGFGGLLDWARRLQPIFAEADLVVLHVHNMDIVPFLALAGMRNRPKVLLLNHGDHLFFLGAGFSDLVVSSRNSGRQLCIDRRGIDAARNMLLPLCLKPAPSDLDRAAAKKALGLPPDSIVILTLARGVKFRTIGGVTFADAFVPIMRADPRVHLVAVGPGGVVDWSRAEHAVQGRIHVFAERADTHQFLEAADIYTDSFPFASITSMFEAGLHELPLLTRYPFGPGCEVMGSDSVGMDGSIQRSFDLAGFQAELRRLIADPEARRTLGTSTKAEIQTVLGDGWRSALQRVYDRIDAVTPIRIAPTMADSPPQYEDMDLVSPFVFGDLARGTTSASREAFAAEIELKSGPALWRWRTLWRLLGQGRLQVHGGLGAWRNLTPEWFGRRMRSIIPRKR